MSAGPPAASGADKIGFGSGANAGATGFEVVAEQSESGAAVRSAPHAARADNQLAGILRIEEEWRIVGAGVAADGGAADDLVVLKVLSVAVDAGFTAEDVGARSEVGRVGDEPLGGIEPD